MSAMAEDLADREAVSMGLRARMAAVKGMVLSRVGSQVGRKPQELFIVCPMLPTAPVGREHTHHVKGSRQVCFPHAKRFNKSCRKYMWPWWGANEYTCHVKRLAPHGRWVRQACLGT